MSGSADFTTPVSLAGTPTTTRPSDHASIAVRLHRLEDGVGSPLGVPAVSGFNDFTNCSIVEQLAAIEAMLHDHDVRITQLKSRIDAAGIP